MRNDFDPTPRDTRRAATVTLYQGATLAELIAGTATGGIDLSPYVTGGRQSHQEVSLRLSWHSEFYGASQPAPGNLLRVSLDGTALWHGVVESINDYRLASGERSMTLTARSRDAMPLWRSVRFVTDTYPAGTDLAIIAADIAEGVGLTAPEYDLPAAGAWTPHSATQLADLPPWTMLEALYAPSGFAPMVDALGRLKLISRDTTRAHDIEIDSERIVSINGSRSRAPLTAVRLNWLDPIMTKVSQQDQVLASATITAGYFQLLQRKTVRWSEDGSQRAESTRMVVKQSANSGILPVCDEDYEQRSLTEGRITLTTSAFVPALIGSFLALKAAAALPDIAPTGGGPTFTVGRRTQAALEFSVLLTMASIGTGMYEIHGTPYDYVNARNKTEAYIDGAERFVEKIEDIESDFVPNETSAQAYAIRELIYRYRSAVSWGATIVDDPRIEPGDILLLSDGSRLYVTGYDRDLSPGAPAVLKVEGFRA